jgi:adenosylcobyric acid synthase
MLGQVLADPLGLEGAPGDSPGFGWLELHTVLEAEKQLRNVGGRLLPGGEPVQGYEIHAGVSSGAALRQPALQLDDGRSDGAVSTDGQIFGTYLHGLFEAPQACAALLEWAGLREAQAIDYAGVRERAIERLADTLEAHLDLPRIFDLLGLPR